VYMMTVHELFMCMLPICCSPILFSLDLYDGVIQLADSGSGTSEHCTWCMQLCRRVIYLPFAFSFEEKASPPHVSIIDSMLGLAFNNC